LAVSGAYQEGIMEDFPIWLKGAVWLVVSVTVIYVIVQVSSGLFG
jgi:hypothetical protein